MIESAERLIAATRELDEISKMLIRTELELERLEPQYEDFIESYIGQLWEDSVENGARLPPQDVRQALALKAMPSDLKGQYRAHIATRRRTKSRLSDLREVVSAHRSIVAAARDEMVAASGPQPAWSGSREFPNG